MTFCPLKETCEVGVAPGENESDTLLQKSAAATRLEPRCSDRDG